MDLSRRNPVLPSALPPLRRSPITATTARRNLAFTKIFDRVGLVLAKTRIFDLLQPKGGPWYKNWRYIATGLVLVASGAYYVSHLEEVPFSPEAKIAEEAYQEMIEEYSTRLLKDDHPIAKVVLKVASDIINAAELADKADWTIHVVDAPEMPTALVLPGGKIFVLTGILPICMDEDGLAVVLGHEIAYISRKMEHEADHIVLILTARACYDPPKAVEFWERFAFIEDLFADDEEPPVMQLWRAHPATAERIKRIQARLEEAEAQCADMSCHVLQDELDRPNAMAAWIKRVVDKARAKAKRDVEELFRLDPVEFD
ncbi:hypothetical protein GGF32_006604 [Allomyces javanicus]|nr:hypothetical protein GGF32_006604 [Allomyces javanicus]